jgi:hypothetical protein
MGEAQLIARHGGRAERGRPIEVQQFYPEVAAVQEMRRQANVARHFGDRIIDFEARPVAKPSPCR